MSKIQTHIQIPTLLIALGMAGMVHAATFDVTNGMELQQALTQAQSNGEADTINLAANTYHASGGTFTYVANSTPGPEENFPLTLQGTGTGKTILDGGDAQQILNIRTVSLSDDGDADVTIQDMTFQHGKTVSTFGGSLQVLTNNADITLKNLFFSSNTADNSAGATRLTTSALGGTGRIMADGNSFIHNNASASAGAAFFGYGPGGAVVTNNIFFDNQAKTGDGGAILLEQFVGNVPLQFINNTVLKNSAGHQGGGVEITYSDTRDKIDLYNNIIFGNTASDVGNDVFIDDQFQVTGTFNLFNNDLSEICFRSSGDCDPAGVVGLKQGGQINVDPQLVAPDNGDFHLTAGSHAIDAGDPNAPALPATDHDGNPRVNGPAPDMGALEVPVSNGGGGGNGGPGNAGGEPRSGCALQSGTPAAWGSLLATLLFLPWGILRHRQRS